jgi:hypothetical protein
MLRRILPLMLLLVASGGVALAAPRAGPTDHEVVAADVSPISVAVTVIHAKEAQGAVDPQLAGLARYLAKSFPKHHEFRRLDTTNARLAVGGETRLTLPNHAQLGCRYEGREGQFIALHLEVGGLKTTVHVKDGGTFFQAGRAYDGGMIVLAFEVKSTK